MPHRIHAAEDAVQPSRRQPPGDFTPAQSEAEQLPNRDGAVLVTGQLGDPSITRSTFCTHTVPKVDRVCFSPP
jgi:hypothetical protein